MVFRSLPQTSNSKFPPPFYSAIQLEEFRKKKEAALAAKKQPTSTTAPAAPVAVQEEDDHTAPAASQEQQEEEVQGLKDQIAQLLESVDGLHRSLNDERYNSTQLEEQLQDLRKQISSSGGGGASSSSEAALTAELEDSRAAASRYAAAAETMSAQLEEANERMENLTSQLGAAETALTSIADYKKQIDALQGELEMMRSTSSSNQAAQEEHLAILTTQLAGKEAAAVELENELGRQLELNHRMKEELVAQAATAEEAYAAEEAEQASLDAEKAKAAQLEAQVAQLQESLQETRAELSSAIDMATERQSEVERLQADLSVASSMAVNAELAGEQQTLLEEMEAALTAAQEESAGLRGQLEDAERELTQRADVEAAMREEVDALRAAVPSSSSDDDANAQLSLLQAERDALLQDLQTGSEATSAANQKISTLEATVEETRAELKVKTEEARALFIDMQHLRENPDQISLLQARLEGTKMRAADLEGQLAEAMDTINNAEYHSSQLKTELKALKAEMKVVTAEKSGLETQRTAAVEKWQQLQTQVDSESGGAAMAAEAVAALEVAQEQINQLTAEKQEIEAYKLNLESQVQELIAEREAAATAARGVDAESASTALEAVAALEMAQEQINQLTATIEHFQREKEDSEGYRVNLEAQVQEATERAMAAEAAGAEAAAAAVTAAQEAMAQQARGEANYLREQLAAAQADAVALGTRVAELEAMAAVTAQHGSSNIAATEELQQQIVSLQSSITEYQYECERYAERVQQLEAAAAIAASVQASGGGNGGGGTADANARVQAAVRRAEGAESQLTQLQTQCTSLRTQLDAEKSRAAQLEAFAERQRVVAAQKSGSSSQMGDKKNEDNVDMEAAALAGGSAFKPLVGVIRSLPSPLSNAAFVAGARELDKAAVALDARPIVRICILLYIILLHVMLIV